MQIKRSADVPYDLDLLKNGLTTIRDTGDINEKCQCHFVGLIERQNESKKKEKGRKSGKQCGNE